MDKVTILEFWKYLDGVSTLQILTLALTSLASRIQLQRDERARTAALLKEASKIKVVLYVFTVISIASVFVSSHSTFNNRIEDKAELSKLSTANARLRSELSKSTIELSQKATDQSRLISRNQQQSAIQLKNAANNLRSTITGTDRVPEFTFLVAGNNLLAGYLKNYSSKPAYNMIIRIINNDYLSGCRTADVGGQHFIDAKCLDTIGKELGVLNHLASNSYHIVVLPRYKIDENHTAGHYTILVNFNGKVYEEQATYEVIKGQLYQACKITEVVFPRVIRSWYSKREKRQLQIKNWKTEFPNTLISLSAEQIL